MQSVHGAYGPSNELKVIPKTELLMRGDQLHDAPHTSGGVLVAQLAIRQARAATIEKDRIAAIGTQRSRTAEQLRK